MSSHGEGKDHLIERVIQPLVPCRRAGSGKMATIPGLFGAMSGDDLNAIEIGLLPKMNHERVAISEFQTWGDETFGELMNMMANGQIEMQKGALDIHYQTVRHHKESEMQLYPQWMAILKNLKLLNELLSGESFSENTYDMSVT